jgi:cellulose synthase/poly-beta-1,6-N-acetylglucosamine synthase-like glycosyltransferase
MAELLLLIIFFFLFLFYTNFLSGIYRGLKKLSPLQELKEADEFISVIIPFRNESDNILKNLESIENQNYPKEKFEVIYINDSSDDGSLEKLCSVKKSDNIKIFSVPEDYSPNAHKKRAVRFGIEKAKGEIIVTTDADCIYKKDWLKTLVSCYDNDTGFVSGPVEFSNGQDIFNKFQRLEFAGLILVGAGLIGINKPAICNAANASYRRKAYDDVKGFSDQLNLSSGDDELLMQKIWKNKKYGVKFCLNKEAIVTSNPNESLQQFYHQRKRWASKGLFYANKFLVVKLILIFLFYLSLIVQPVLGIFYSSVFLISFLISFGGKIISEYLIIKKGTEILFEKEILKPFLFVSFLHIPYIIIFGLAGSTGNFDWKGRTVKR